MFFHIEVLKKTTLFQDIDSNDLPVLLNCLAAQEKSYGKDIFLFHAGDPVRHIGVVLSGTVQIIKEDIWGNRSIVTELAEGQLFAEVFAWVGLTEIPVAVLAKTACRVLWLPADRIVGTCSAACGFHGQLVRNMLRIIAQKNLMLNNKLDLLSKRSIREKLLSYFYAMAKERGGTEFTVPFNRNELADFLCIDRSAMSRELGKMKEEGLLDFAKDRFHIFAPPV